MHKRRKPWPCSNKEEQGRQAEEAFFDAWTNKHLFPKWMVSVERPTEVEDLWQKTDAVIIRISGVNLKIQIKSYSLWEESLIELMDYGVIPVCISFNDSANCIINKTLNSVKTFLEYSKNSSKDLNPFPLKKKEESAEYYFIRNKKRISN